MRRMSVVIVAVVLGVGAITIAADGATTPDFILKLGHASTEGAYTSTEGAFSTVFKGVIETRTGGKIKVEIFPAGQLGGQRELTEATKRGDIQAAYVSEAILSLFYRKAEIFSMPYFFTRPDDPYRLFNSPWGKEFVQDCIKASGIRVLQAQGFGFRSLTNNKRPIRSPNDAVGLKIRVMESPVPLAMIKAIGASPTPISVTELYTALQQGVVDGEENPPIVLTALKFYEVQKYMTLNRHQLGTALAVMNERFYQRLPKEFQAVVDDAADLGAKAVLGLSLIANEGESLKFLNERMEIYTPTEAEIAAFKAKMQPAARKVIVDHLGEEFVNRAVEAVRNLP
jgi:TRAP-type transport system periplasmic protein